MDIKNITIGGLIIVILSLLMYNSYNSIEERGAKYEEKDKKNQSTNVPKKADLEQLNEPASIDEAIDQKVKSSQREQITSKQNFSDRQERVPQEKISERKSDFKREKVFTYSSGFYDIEQPNGQMITVEELTYHIFDFNKRTVTQNSVVNGERINITYPFTNMYEEEGLVATTYVLTVNRLGVKEIWWSPDVPNLGYDYDDGTRIACYDIKIKK